MEGRNTPKKGNMAEDGQDKQATRDRSVARWALRARDSCKELRMMEFCGAGAIQVRLQSARRRHSDVLCTET